MKATYIHKLGVVLMTAALSGACTVKRDAPAASSGSDDSKLGDFVLNNLDFSDVTGGGGQLVSILHEDEERAVVPPYDRPLAIPQHDESDGSELVAVFLGGVLLAFAEHQICNTGPGNSEFFLMNGGIHGFTILNDSQTLTQFQDELVLFTVARLGGNVPDDSSQCYDTGPVLLYNDSNGVDTAGTYLQDELYQVPSSLLHHFKGTGSAPLHWEIGSGRTEGGGPGNWSASTGHLGGMKYKALYIVRI